MSIAWLNLLEEVVLIVDPVLRRVGEQFLELIEYYQVHHVRTRLADDAPVLDEELLERLSRQPTDIGLGIQGLESMKDIGIGCRSGPACRRLRGSLTRAVGQTWNPWDMSSKATPALMIEVLPEPDAP